MHTFLSSFNTGETQAYSNAVPFISIFRNDIGMQILSTKHKKVKVEYEIDRIQKIVG